MKYCVIFVTVPDNSVGKKIAQKILKNKLCACVNIVTKIKSSYWWKNKIEHSDESLLIIKTKRTVFTKLLAYIKKIHPYTVPEIIALPIEAGNKEYLNWISKSIR